MIYITIIDKDITQMIIDKDMAEMTLKRMMIDFCINTAYGYYSAIYKTLRIHAKNPDLRNIIMPFNVKYYNSLYKSLILKNDENVIRNYDEMHRLMNHSYICLLNITYYFTSYMVNNVKPEQFFDESYEKYMESVKGQLEKMIDVSTLVMNHECCGIDIATCNPNEDMFYLNVAE